MAASTSAPAVSEGVTDELLYDEDEFLSKICQFYNSPYGCRRGPFCGFEHRFATPDELQVQREHEDAYRKSASRKQRLKDRVSLAGRIHKAWKILLHMERKSDRSVPFEVIRRAQGIALISTVKAGFIFSGIIGAGVVLVRLPGGGWSGPCSIGTAGMGWGLQIGAQHTETVIILNNHKAVNVFSGRGQLKLGGDVSVSAGPVGRSGGAAISGGDGGAAACFSYSAAKGAFAGLSLEGEVIGVRKDDNRRFYGVPVTPKEIFSGEVDIPYNEDYVQLIRCLDRIDKTDSVFGEAKHASAPASTEQGSPPGAPPQNGSTATSQYSPEGGHAHQEY